jgi:hypothetical protein
VYPLISKLVSLLPEEDLHPETSELVNQLIFIPGTEKSPFKDRASISLDIASLLGYRSNYLPTTQATTQLPTPSPIPELPTTQLPTPQVDTHRSNSP